MSQVHQLTLDGQVLLITPEEEKALLIKVKSSFSKQMVNIKTSSGEIIEAKKYKAVFSSAPSSIIELLNCIKRECPAAVEKWIAAQRED